MGLQEIIMELDEGPLPAEAEAFVVEAERQIDELFETERNRRMPKYLPSDPRVFYRALAYLTEQDLPLGRTFCEWGSGFGLATGLAAQLGYKAFGLELEDELVDASVALGEKMGVDYEILQTSYLPEGFETFRAVGGTGLIIPDHHSDNGSGDYFSPSYEGMEMTTDEVDVYFVYPWPREHHLMQQLFETVACDGSILLLYHGENELRAYRRVIGEEKQEDELDEEEEEEGNVEEGWGSDDDEDEWN